jgi:hypothetical protein
LIYGSYAESETAEFLFLYNPYLKVYKRPFVDELISLCKSRGEIIVYTTALKSYAIRISKTLKIAPIELLSRKNCTQSNGYWKKRIKNEWLLIYDKIIIIDDSPNVWIDYNDKVLFLIPNEFRGCINDKGLIKIIDELKLF